MIFSRLVARAGRGVRKDSSARGRRSKTLRLETLEPRIALAAAGLVPVGAQPTGPLTGKIVYTSGGHGWQWNSTLNRYATDRGDNNEIVEDFGNQEQMTAYVDYLFRAGATVVPMRPVGRQIHEVVLDNDSSGVTFSGSWSNSTSTRYYDEDYGTVADTVPYRFASTTTGAETATATYTPNIPAAGMYPVYTWVLRGTDRVNQLYEINHTGGTTQVRVNHSMVGSGWVYLGTYHFDGGSSVAAGSVKISNNVTTPGGVIIADAIRFGNGMGDYIASGAPTISGYPREDENSLHWIARSLGIGTTLSQAASTGNVSAPSNFAQWMNANTNPFGTSVYIGFHSNATTGNPATATARGAVGLIDSDQGTPNQSSLALYLGRQINQDMQALNGQFEHNWSTRTTHTFTSGFGEIDLGAGAEMDATIIETAFHDNIQDAAIMRDPKGRDALARATYQGTLEYFDVFGGLTSPVSVATPPTNVRAVSNAPGEVTVSWSAGPTAPASALGGAATGFRIYASTNGYGFDGGTFVAGGSTTSLTLTGYDPTLPYYFRVVAVNAGGESKPSEVMTALASGGEKQVLIVNGFDRFDRTQNFRYAYAFGSDSLVDRVWPRYNNSFDYVVQYHTAIHGASAGTHVASTSNEAVISGAVNLSDYKTVIWILGNETTDTRTLDATEQTKLSQFIAAGGNLLISGSEIAWDLDQQNNGRTFYENTLKGTYVANAAGTYTTTAVSGGIFAGMSNIVFSSGSPSTGANAYSSRDTQLYNVNSADVIAPQAGAVAALNYNNGSGAAAIQAAGTGGAGSIVMLAFPFETINSAALRQTAMGRILEFFAPAAPAIDLKTRINGQDADSPLGEVFAVGDTATLTYVLTNPGGVALSGVALVDDNGTPGMPDDDFVPVYVGGDANGNSQLDPGETWNFSASRTVAAGQQMSTASVSAQGGAESLQASDSAYFFGSAPALALQALVNGDDANSPPGPALPVGAFAFLTYSLGNTGNIALSGIILVDDAGTPGDNSDNITPVLTSGDANGNNLLDVGETWVYTAFVPVTVGPRVHTTTAIAFDPLFQIIVQVDVANYLGAPAANADFDASGRVDGADFLAWQIGFGKSGDAALADGDANGDQNVDVADFDLWAAAFGDAASLGATSSAALVVQAEPGLQAETSFVPPLLVAAGRREATYIDFRRRAALTDAQAEPGDDAAPDGDRAGWRATAPRHRPAAEDQTGQSPQSRHWASCVDLALGGVADDSSQH